MSKTTTKKRFQGVKNAWKNRAKYQAYVREGVNKAWILTVLATLWGAAYVMYTATEKAVPENVKVTFACALAALGLMWLIRNIRPNAVVE